jgi:FkbM family methyltransferase
MGVAKIQDWVFEYLNGEELRELKQEIYTQHSYYVELRTGKPRIIDAGAHIGLATGYFLWLYPQATIQAIEPNPRLASLWRRNAENNQWRQADLTEAALAATRGSLPFYYDKSPEQWYSTGSFNSGAWNKRQQSYQIQVMGVPLSDFLSEPVDLLKLDIEGAEGAVLRATGDKLRMIKHLLMEYHPVKGNSLEEIQKLLEKLGFTVRIKHKHKQDPELKLIEAVAGYERMGG